jgi:WD40 repeat protein
MIKKVVKAPSSLLDVATVRVGPATVVVTAGDDGYLRAWDIDTDRDLLAVRSHDGGVRAVAARSSGERSIAVSGGTDGVLRVWDLLIGELVATLPGHIGWVREVAFIDGIDRVVSAGDDQTLRVWDLRAGSSTVLQGHRDAVLTVAAGMVHGQPLAVSASADGTVRVWDISTGDSFRIPLGGCYGLALEATTIVAATHLGVLAISLHQDDKAFTGGP